MNWNPANQFILKAGQVASLVKNLAKKRIDKNFTWAEKSLKLVWSVDEVP